MPIADLLIINLNLVVRLLLTYYIQRIVSFARRYSPANPFHLVVGGLGHPEPSVLPWSGIVNREQQDRYDSWYIVHLTDSLADDHHGLEESKGGSTLHSESRSPPSSK
jgi:hypothetical protein